MKRRARPLTVLRLDYHTDDGRLHLMIRNGWHTIPLEIRIDIATGTAALANALRAELEAEQAAVGSDALH